MAIKRYIADKDTTITNAFKANMLYRGTGSNMGAADTLEMFSIYGQATTASTELSRILLHFPTSQMATDRTAGRLAASGEPSFYLRLFNARHSETLPKHFTASVYPVTKSWDEGTGLDMSEYSDAGYANWMSASSTTKWATNGGDFDSSEEYNQYFDQGTENLEMNVTSLVEDWLAGSRANNGLMVKLTGSHEVDTVSWYTKKFYARRSQFYFLKPIIEARWDDSIKDDRNSFYYSSSLVAGTDNKNTLYLYNNVRGQLRNLPNKAAGSKVYVKLYSGSTGITGSALKLHDLKNHATGGWVSTGIYSCSLCITSSGFTKLFDVWYSGSRSYMTSSFEPKTLASSNYSQTSRYSTKITNLKPSYTTTEKPKLRTYVRARDWQPTVYTVARNTADTTTIEDAYYKVVRTVDNYEVIGYGTGSDQHTALSHDVSGNYFHLDMGLLEPDYMYTIRLTYLLEGSYSEQPESYKFRVQDDLKDNS